MLSIMVMEENVSTARKRTAGTRIFYVEKYYNIILIAKDAQDIV